MHFSFVTYSFDEVPRKVIRWLRVDERLVSKQRQLTKVQVWLPDWLCGSGRTLWRPHSDFMDMLRHLISCRIIIIIIGL